MIITAAKRGVRFAVLNMYEFENILKKVRNVLIIGSLVRGKNENNFSYWFDRLYRRADA